MSLPRCVLAFLYFGFVLFGHIGCSSKPAVGPDETTSSGFKDLWNAYRHYIESHNKPPARAGDLLKLSIAFPYVEQMLNERGILVQWNVNLLEQSKEKSVLAYEQTAPTEGGFVLLTDGTVQKMNVADFNSASKAK